MNICKPLFTIIVASMLSGLAPQVIASPVCKVKITSSTIKIVNQGNEPKAIWQVSGNCLEKITKVFLAKDEGKGYEVLYPDLDKKNGLIIPVVPRNEGIGVSVAGALIGEHVVSAGQYLLQLISCRIDKNGKEKNCKIEDEAFIPAVGDITTIATLMAIDTKIQSDSSTFKTKIKNLFGL